MRVFAFAVIAVAACSPAPPEPMAAPDKPKSVIEVAAEMEGVTVAQFEQKLAEERADETRKIQALDASGSVNWISVGISTGKFSESIGSSVHRTHTDCLRAYNGSDNTCFPIPALPKSYWNDKP